MTAATRSRRGPGVPFVVVAWEMAEAESDAVIVDTASFLRGPAPQPGPRIGCLLCTNWPTSATAGEGPQSRCAEAVFIRGRGRYYVILLPCRAGRGRSDLGRTGPALDTGKDETPPMNPLLKFLMVPLAAGLLLAVGAARAGDEKVPIDKLPK